MQTQTSKLERTVLDISDYCSLIQDTLHQERSDSPGWAGMEDRVKRYLGSDGLLKHIHAAFNPELSREAREEKLVGAIQESKKVRAWVLDAAEQAIAPSPRWASTRARLLKYFGARGIEGLLSLALEPSSEKGDCNGNR